MPEKVQVIKNRKSDQKTQNEVFEKGAANSNLKEEDIEKIKNKNP